MDGSPPAADRASPRICPVCRHDPDPGRRRSDGDSAVRVTNLPEDTREPDLYDLFAPFGILDRVLLSSSAAAENEKPGSVGRFGIIEFEQVEDAEQAISWLDGDDYGGRVLRVEWVEPFVPPPICASCLRDAETFIRVSNLSEGTCERDLYNLACPFGCISRLHLAVDEESGSVRQWGAVEFDDRDDAEQAVRWLNGHVYDDLVLRVEGPLKLRSSDLGAGDLESTTFI
ncbi:hypothetical protein BAE44_0012995 [Dichanthelium oligosanthes]|uniref:RRM domain-containing protein n=1 Tax=Dichanthelium oligosanthes TaxID=888268 RepID=A0A1E5VLI6_9POAL|nr:hypothetical protein BAE44_0012995 [Dichanthelium oligosanthes]